PKPATPAAPKAPAPKPTAPAAPKAPASSVPARAGTAPEKRADTSPSATPDAGSAAPAARGRTVIPQVIPDMVLNARPVAAAIGNVTSRLSGRMKALIAAVLLPAMLALLYFGLWASPMYISEARFAVRSAESGGAGSGLAALLLPTGSSVGADAQIVAEYIQSPDIMEAIDEEMHIISHFSSHDHDIISRLASDATRDDRLDYWQWAVKPAYDPETGIIALTVKAYDPATSKKLAESILSKSEALVNAMSHRAQDDAITLAMGEVKTAENRVRKAQEAMRSFRDRSGMLDPASTAGGLQTLVSSLEAEVAKTRAEIAEASTYMSRNAPTLVGLRARLAAVEKQLAAEKLRLAGESGKSGSLTSYAGEYEGLATESEFARQQLVSAMASLEAARIKAEAKSRYVVAFQLPALADESLYPRPFLFSAYVLLGALVLAGLFSLIIAAIREHAGF
ncbi:MAG: hypothetical protein Q4F72_11630, partial [Desulfovibrionaceae bacterium]|nr:hypothetical protein [Desulfovibrionaceae bacterium]